MNQLSPGITLAIPVYNREASLSSLLQSIEEQSRLPDKIILIDNNSSDNSREILTRWARRKVEAGLDVEVISESRPGASAARKAAEKIITTQYVAFFDSDDVMHPDYIEAAMRDFESDPELKLTVWNLNFNNPDGTVAQRRFLKGHTLENHLVQGLLSTQAYAIDTHYLRSIGGWNPSIGGWDDFELGLRILLGNGKLKITDTPRAEVTVQEDSITGLSYLHRLGDWEHTLDEMEHVAKAHPTADASTIRHIIRLIAYRRAILAAHYYHEGDRNAGQLLLRKALSVTPLNPAHRLIIRAAYLFTRTGLPGAGAIFPPLLR